MARPQTVRGMASVRSGPLQLACRARMAVRRSVREGRGNKHTVNRGPVTFLHTSVNPCIECEGLQGYAGVYRGMQGFIEVCRGFTGAIAQAKSSHHLHTTGPLPPPHQPTTSLPHPHPAFWSLTVFILLTRSLKTG